MNKSAKKNIWIIVAIVFLISLSSEFAEMTKQIGLKDALISFLGLMVIVIGIVYWIKKSKKAK